MCSRQWTQLHSSPSNATTKFNLGTHSFSWVASLPTNDPGLSDVALADTAAALTLGQRHQVRSARRLLLRASVSAAAGTLTTRLSALSHFCSGLHADHWALCALSLVLPLLAHRGSLGSLRSPPAWRLFPFVQREILLASCLRHCCTCNWSQSAVGLWLLPGHHSSIVPDLYCGQVKTNPFQKQVIIDMQNGSTCRIRSCNTHQNISGPDTLGYRMLSPM